MEPIQTIIIIFSLFALSRTLLRWKDRSLRQLEAMFFVLLWTILIIVAFVPNMFGFISLMFGIGRLVDLFVYVGIIAMFYLNFRLYVKMEEQKQEMTELVRRLSIKRK